MKDEFSILVVDDDKNLGLNLKDILEENNYKTEIVFDGQSAIDLCKKRHFDLSLVDISLPDVGGLQLVDQISKMYSDTEYVIITGHSRIEHAAEAVRSKKIVAYETKPLEMDHFIALIKQIKERKKAEHESRKAAKRLEESEEKLRTFMDSALDGFGLFDKDLNLIEVNEAVLRYLPIGTRREHLIGKNLRELSLYAKSIDFYSALKKVAETGEPLITEKVVPARVPDLIEKHIFLKVFKVDQGLGLIASDMTELKKAEKRIKESEEKYRNLFETMAQGVVYQNAGGQIISANPAAEKILGLTLDQMQGRTSVDPRWKSIHEDGSDFPGENHPAMVALKTGKEVRDIVMGVFNLKTEQYKWIKIDASPQFKPGESKPYQVYATFTDITASNIAEKALKESEEKYRILFERAAEGILVADVKSKDLVYANPAICKLLGYSENELIKMMVNDIHPKESLDLVLAEFEAQARNEKVTAFNIPCLKKNKKIVHCDISTVKIIMQGRECNLGYFTDISERNQAEQALKESENNLRSVFKTIPDALYVIEQDSNKIIDINDAAVNLYGYSREEWLKMKATDVSAEPEKTEKAIKSAKIKIPIRYHRKKDGTVFPVEITANSLISKGRSLVIAAGRDITERLEMEKTLKENEEKYHVLFDSSLVGIGTSDLEGNMLSGNQAIQKITGYSLDEIKGVYLDSIYFDPDDRKRFIKELKKKGRVENFEVRFKRKDKSICTVLMNSCFIESKGEKIILTNMQDITERKRSLETIKYFANLVEIISDAIISFDMNYTIKSWNNGAEKIYGWKAHEVIGKNINDVIPVKFSEDNKNEVLEKFSERGFWTGEGVQYHKNGRKLNILSSSVIMKDATNKPAGIVTISKDITERKVVEDKLKASEEQFRVLSEASLTGIFIFQDMVFMYANPALGKIFGYSSKEIVGKLGPLELTDSKDHKGGKDYIKTCLSGHKNISPFTFRGLKKNGQIIYCEVLASGISYRGKPAVIGTVMDITNRKRTEEALQRKTFKLGKRVKELRSLYKLEEISNNEEQSIKEFFENVVKIIPAAMQYPEITRAKIIFKGDEYKSKSIKINKHSLKSDIIIDNKKSGRVEVCYSKKMPEKDEGPFLKEERSLINSIAIRISEFIELKQSREECERILNLSDDLICIAGMDGFFKYVNPAWQRILGYTENELLSKPFLDFIHPDDHNKNDDEVESLSQGNKTLDFENRYIHKEGSVRTFSWTATPVVDEGLIYYMGRDITEKKRINEAMRLLSERNKAILESVPDIIMEVNYNKVYTWANHAGFEFFGDDVLGKEAEFYFEGEQETYTTVKPLFNGSEEIIFVESWQRRKDGQKRLLAWWCRVLKDKNGRVKGALSTARDITEQKQLEEVLRIQRDFGIALSQSKDLYEILNLCLDSAMKISDMDCGGVYLFDTNTGSLDLIVQRGLSDNFLKNISHYDKKSDNVKLIKKGKIYYKKYEEFDFAPTDFRRREGIKFLGVIPLYSEGKVIACLNVGSHAKDDCDENSRKNLEIIGGTIGNIIARGKSEEALKKSQALLAATGKTAKVGGWEFNVQTQELVWTDEVFRIHEVDPRYQPVVEKAIEFYVPESKPVITNAVQNAIEKGVPYDLELQIVTAKGNFRWVHTIGQADKSNRKTVRIWGIFQDITDRKRAEEEIYKLNEELEQRVIERTAQLEASNKELEAFSYSVSHDLRAPLHHISGFSSLLQKRATSVLDDKSVHYLDVISESVEKMGRLIDDLLNFSRTGRTELQKSKIKFESALKEVIDEMRLEQGKRKIDWKFGDLPEVYADRSMLRIVLINLISNAVKFTRNSRRPAIEIGYLPGNKYEQEFFIKDNGVGFDMKYKHKLYGVFQRLHRSEDFEGTGIGLANVRRIIYKHGGRTWAESETGKGATFYFSLPKVSATETRRT